MATFEFLTMSIALACLLGPMMGVIFLIGYQLMVRLGRRGFTLRVGLPPDAAHQREKRPYDRK